VLLLLGDLRDRVREGDAVEILLESVGANDLVAGATPAVRKESIDLLVGEHRRHSGYSAARALTVSPAEGDSRTEGGARSEEGCRDKLTTLPLIAMNTKKYIPTAVFDPIMLTRLRETIDRVYLRQLRRDLDRVPKHVAVIQDGNRRYAREQGESPSDGHRAGAETTEQLLDWCVDLGIEEVTLYAFSTENFERPAAELEPLFTLLETKIREFAGADRVHDQGVSIRAIGDLDRFPASVREAVTDAERRTADYDTFRLNIALGYGGRDELLTAARAIARDVAEGRTDPADVDVDAVERRLNDRPTHDVDLIIRTGGDERTSNFLPWHANGNEAAVYFCAPYWPAFSEIDFMRAIRTYQSREESWRYARRERAVALVRAAAAIELEEAKRVAARLRERLPRRDRAVISAAVPDGGSRDRSHTGGSGGSARAGEEGTGEPAGP